MIEFLKTIPPIIKEAAKSRLGVFSLMILLFFFLVFNFFNNEDAIIKIMVFSLLFLGIMLFSLSLSKVEEKHIIYKKDKNHIPIKRRLVTLFIIVIMIFGAIGLTSYNLFFQNQTKYFKDVRRSLNGWIGIHKISLEEANKSNRYYRFTYDGYLGLVKSVENLNGSGGYSIKELDDIFGNILLKECSDVRSVKVQFTYNDNKKLIQEKFIDQSSRQLLNIDYSEDGEMMIFHYTKFVTCSKNKSSVVAARVKYDQNNQYIKRIQFCNSDFVNIADENGVFGYDYKYDKYSNIISKSSLDKEKYKLTTEYRFDNMNNLIEESYWTPNGGKTFKDGLHKIIYKRDEVGNILEISYLDDANNLTYDDTGICHVKNKLNEHGEYILSYYYDTQMHLSNNSDGYCISKSKYNSIGREIEETYFDENNKPTYFSKGGYYKIVKTYDENQRLISASFFDNDSKPILNYEGCHKKQFIYNKSGYMTEVCCYGIDNKLTTDTGGVAILKNEFNNQGFRVLIYALDENENFVNIFLFDDDDDDTPIATGITKQKIIYDSKGNVIEDINLNKLNKPVTSTTSGVARTKYEIRNNLTIEAHYYDANNNYVSNKMGFQKFEYDIYRREIIRKDYEKPDVPMEGEWPFKTVFHYNNYNQIIIKEYYDKNNHFKNTNGYCIEKTEYDRKGRKTKISYYDPLFHLSESSIILKYNKYGNVIELNYLNSEGNLKRTGIATIKKEYNKKGYLVKKLNYDYAGNLINDEYGISVYTFEKDSYGRTLSESGYNSTLQPELIDKTYHKIIYKRDKMGRISEQKYLDINNYPFLVNEGYCSVRYRYNSVGQIILEQYFDCNGKPAPIYGQYQTSVEFNYDERGFLLSRIFKKNNTLIKNQFGIAIITETRNELNKLLTKQYWDEKDQPINSIQGFHKVIYTYDRLFNEKQDKFTVTGEKIL